jgi:MFS family permease
VTSLLLAGRLIGRFGAASVVTGGIAFFTSALIYQATIFGSEPDMAAAIIGMIPAGIGVGLMFPTLMGVGASSLPPSSFATGSGVINMIRQAAFAVGVAIFVAVVAAPASRAARVDAFHRGWWIMAAITLLGLVPTYFLIRPVRARQQSAIRAASG